MASAANAALVKEVQDQVFPAERLLLLVDDELGFAQPSRGDTTRQLYAVYVAAVPELTVLPPMLQISDYLGASVPKAGGRARRAKDTPVRPLTYITYKLSGYMNCCVSGRSANVS